MQTTTIDPRIGTLNRNGQTVYYAHLPLASADKWLVDAENIYVEHTDIREIEAYLEENE